jgi:predicted RNase H-like nuclease (RuvC/YqgF family)
MDQLSQEYPLQADAMPAAVPSESGVAVSAGSMEPVMKMAAAIGLEIAKSVGEGIRSVLDAENLGSPDVSEVRKGLEDAAARISEAMVETEALKAENRELKEKLAVMEAEMVRLRKDRREMEKYLLDKIKSVST